MPSDAPAQHHAMEAATHGMWGVPYSVAADLVAADEFNESDHPRDADGKFGSGVGGKAAAKPKLTPTEKTYVSNYTGDDFLDTNKRLRAGDAGGGIVKHVDAAIEKETLPAGTKLYRGMDKEAAIQFLGTRDIEAGLEFSDKAFMSTSRRSNIGYGTFGGVIFEIETGEGQNGLDVAGLTRNPSEQEVLLPRNTKLRVKSIVAPKKIGDAIRIKVTTVTDGDAARSDAESAVGETLYAIQPNGALRAAGIMLLTREREALFVKRGPGSDYPGMWAFPGGRLELGETTEQAAIRETAEEIGAADYSNPVFWTRQISNRETTGPMPTPVVGAPLDTPLPNAPPGEATVEPGLQVDFTTYLAKVNDKFVPTLNYEHTGFAWASVDEPPEPLHPGARIALARLTMDELGVARAIAAGDLTSPQKYENVWLFAIRITGTGASYRTGHDEHVWRDSAIYLNDEFLARCNGLTVVWIHPKKSVLDSDEFAKRVIGSIFLPYINGDEVWGIAKIYDEQAAREMQARPISTSPGVTWNPDRPVNTKVELDDGRTLLIEGKPALLDHIAVVDRGVWDKGGPPAGVLNNASLERFDTMADEPTRQDAEGGLIDKVLARLDEVIGKSVTPLMERMDAWEAADKARKDAEEEKHRADAKSRRDAEREAWMRDDAETCARDDAEEASEAEALEKAGEAKEIAADKARSARKDRMKARRDAAESEDERKSREDKARRDAEENARKDADAAAERARVDTIVADSRKIAEALARTPKSSADADYAAMADAQHTYDPAYQAFGQRARAPMQGEDLLAYRRSLARGLQKHSPDWKSVDLHALPDAALGIAETRIRADAIVASRNTDDMPEGELFPVRRTNESGHQITEFRGRTTIFKQFTPPHKRVTKFLTERRA